MVYRFSLNDENDRINGQRLEGKWEAKVQFSWVAVGVGLMKNYANPLFIENL